MTLNEDGDMKLHSALLLSTVLLAPFASSAFAQQTANSSVCVRGGDERIISVVQPGEVGQLCDVRYEHSSGEVRTPFHADNSLEFCQMKAKDLSEELAAAGFACGESSVTAAAAPAVEQSDYVVEARRIEETAPIEEPVIAAEAAPEVAVNVEQTASLPEQDETVQTAMSEILSEPPLTSTADRGPAKLLDENAPAPRSGVRTASVGRIVGVQPSEEAAPDSGPALQREPLKSVQPVIQASATVEQPQAELAQNAEPAQAATATSEPRSPEDVIRAVLRARAAAWNEGNLDAFMETYWRNDDLKFVSGASVNKGWSAAMRRYRDEYGRTGGLGLVEYDRMDVSMVTDDVAVVSGRYNLTRGEASEAGTVSLVLRQMDGLWRIVHDHTNPDAVKSAE